MRFSVNRDGDGAGAGAQEGFLESKVWEMNLEKGEADAGNRVALTMDEATLSEAPNLG